MRQPKFDGNLTSGVIEGVDVDPARGVRIVRPLGEGADSLHESRPNHEKGIQDANKGRLEELCLRRAAKGRVARGARRLAGERQED